MSSSDIAVPLASSPKLYRAIWRWHFYAGLVVVPFLLMLSLTGLGILWFTTIAPEYGDRIVIEKSTDQLRPTALANTVLKDYPDGKIGQYIAPYGAGFPAIVRVDREAGARMIAIDPGSGKILQDRPQAGTWNEFLTDIHGTLLIGADKGPGDLIIETAASLGVIMIVTGIYLWWPRGGSTLRRALTLEKAQGRQWWKSLHSVTGAWVSLILLFFFLSGLAWSSIWGGKFTQAWSTFPAEKWDNVPLSNVDHASMNHGAKKEVPWTLEQTLLPQSGSQTGLAGLPEGVAVNLDSVAILARALGFDDRFQIATPAHEKGVWTISRDSMSYDSTNPFSDRTVHVDQYTGKVLAEADFKDYPVFGKAMAVGLALHEGQTGWWNIIANFMFCMAVLTLCVSGIVMWWMRRPAKVLGAPLYARETRIPVAVLASGVLLSAAFPLGGIAIVAFAVIDYLLPTRLKQVGTV